MEIKLGIRDLNRELSYDVDMATADLEASVRTALGDPDGILTLTDSKGRTALIPSRNLAYVELGADHARPVGFGTL